MRRVAALLTVLAVPALAEPCDVPCPPADAPITDLADVIGAPATERIALVCRTLLDQKRVPLVVVTIPSLEGLGIETFALRLLAQWQFDAVEADGRNWEKGILLLVSPKDKKCRIELGTGWGTGRNLECRAIVEDWLLPRFRKGDYEGGIEAGVAALDGMARGTPVRSPRGKSSGAALGHRTRAPRPLHPRLAGSPRHARTRVAYVEGRVLGAGLGALDPRQLPGAAAPRLGLSRRRLRIRRGLRGHRFVPRRRIPRRRRSRRHGILVAMRRASEWFTEEQGRAIAQAVQQAEASTSAEIVPVVATRSGRYDRAEDSAGVFLGLVLLAGSWCVFQGLDPEAPDWGLSATRFELPAMVAAFLLGFVGGAVAAARLGVLGRLFTPRAQMEEEVAARARAVFFDQRVHHTAGRGGLLHFLSLHERMACVLGDDEILERLGQPVLDEVCGLLVSGMRAGDPTAALQDAIRAAGGHLAKALPREAGDLNEIGDALVTLDE